nr:hypothetical protein GCM10020093_019650 [Planobispora longispora]
MEVVYLHHIHWQVVFDCVLHVGADEPTAPIPATSGLVLLSEGIGPDGTMPVRGGRGVVLLGEGVGQGGATPVLDGRGVLPRDEVNRVEPLPDGQ